MVCRAFGPVEDVEIVDGPDPVPGPGEVLVEVEAAGVGFVDALIVRAGYQLRPELPFTPGTFPVRARDGDGGGGREPSRRRPRRRAGHGLRRLRLAPDDIRRLTGGGAHLVARFARRAVTGKIALVPG
ncbi:hypothetical protein GCM10023199_19110 [Actinomycetospora chibensis]